MEERFSRLDINSFPGKDRGPSMRESVVNVSGSGDKGTIGIDYTTDGMGFVEGRPELEALVPVPESNSLGRAIIFLVFVFLLEFSKGFLALL